MDKFKHNKSIKIFVGGGVVLGGLLYFLLKLPDTNIFQYRPTLNSVGTTTAISVNAVTVSNVLSEIATSTFTSPVLGLEFDYHARGIFREHVINGNNTEEDVFGLDRWSGTLEGSTPLNIRVENEETIKLYQEDGDKIIGYTGQTLVSLCDSQSFLNKKVFKIAVNRCELQKSNYGVDYIFFDITASPLIPYIGTPEQMKRAQTIPLYAVRGIMTTTQSQWSGMTIYITDSPYQNVTNVPSEEYENLTHVLGAIGKSLRRLPKQISYTFERYRDEKSGLSFLAPKGMKIDSSKRIFTFVNQEEKDLMTVRFSLPHENKYENPNARTLADYEKDYSIMIPAYNHHDDLRGSVHVSQSDMVSIKQGIKAVKQKYVVHVIDGVTGERYMDKSGGLDYFGFRYVFYVPQKGFYFMEVGDLHLDTSLTEIEKTIINSLEFWHS